MLQSSDVEDDGSYSVYAMRQGLDYINVEAQNGDLSSNIELISFVNRYYNYPDMTSSTWEFLRKGDLVDLVATSSAYDESSLQYVKKALGDLGLRVSTRYAKQEEGGNPLGYSNTDAERLSQLYAALSAPDSKAVWCIRGGAGVNNFLPTMIGMNVAHTTKPLIGFSDVTGVHLFLNGKWNWPSIHGVLAEYNSEVDSNTGADINKSSSLAKVAEMLMGELTELHYTGLQPLNKAARNLKKLPTTLIGGNLTLLSTVLETTLQPLRKPFTLIIEGVGNNKHQLERMMDQIAYSHSIGSAQAVLLGEFLKSEEGDLEHDIQATKLVLQRFADKLEIPVFSWEQFGHGFVNQPLPLNTGALIEKVGDGFTLTVAVK